MSTTSQLCQRNRQIGTASFSTPETGVNLRTMVQYVWVGLTFLLFLVLGPFAAIAVVPAVFSMAGELREAPLPEMADDRFGE